MFNISERNGLNVNTSKITRRDALKSIGAGMLSLGASGSLAVSKRDYEKPNIVLIMADDLGYGDIGCYGNTRISTPNIDYLAENGLKFMDYHSNGPICSPTRAALLTGRYQQRSGIEAVVSAKNHRHTGMSLSETTFAEALKKANYVTALFGKWHLGYSPDFNPVRQGFDEFNGFVSGNIDYHSHIDQEGYEDWWQGMDMRPENGYTTDLITSHGVRFIEQNKDKPFCLYLAHESPHYPFQGRNDPADRSPGDPKPLHGSRKDKQNAYKEMIEAMDEGIGKILQSLKRLNLERQTFVFFCSDNGAMAGVGSNGILKGSKGTLFEGGHRVPAIAYWPGTIPSGLTRETAMSMDLFPTIVAIAGIPPTDKCSLDGIDLTRLIIKGEKLNKRPLFWKLNKQKAVRSGDWKLYIIDDQSMLYNLEEDIEEKNNAAGIHPELVETLKSKLNAWEHDVSSNVKRRS